MGNVYLSAKVRDIDIPVGVPTDTSRVLCLTNADVHLERNEEMCYGRLRTVLASTIKTAYQALQSST